jgi:nitrite reductase/ring-hydroxylating ferredoxin subunit
VARQDLNRRPTLSSSTIDAPAEAPGTPPSAGFNEYLLGGVVGLTVFAILLTIGLYLLPGDPLQIPELQPAVRVATEADFRIGSSRVVNWGKEVILVVRSGGNHYDALQGTSPVDGCLLQWDPASIRVLSPCKFVVYDLHGNVVRGLTTVPLHRYTVFVRQGTVYVAGR